MCSQAHQDHQTPSTQPTLCQLNTNEHKITMGECEFQKILCDRIIRQLHCSYASPFHLVPKQDTNSFQVCVHYRRMNSSMTPNHHIPHLRNFILGVQMITIIPKLDLAKVKYRYQFQKKNS